MKTNVTIGLCIVIVLLSAGSASAWLGTNSHRQSMTLTGGTDGAQTDYQLKLNIAYVADMQADFDDLRFTQSDGTTLIDAWLESKVDGVSADVWVKFPTTPADGVEQTYYMYYGNSGAGSDWSIDNTFVFGDDFSTTKSGYLSSGTWDVIGGELVNSGGSSTYYIRNIGAPPYIIFAKMKTTTDNNWWGIVSRETSAYAHQGGTGFQPQPHFNAVLRRVGSTPNDLTKTGLLNTYHNYELFDSGSSGKFLYDGGDEVTIDSSVNNLETYAGFGGALANWGTVDLWYVRKYAANPPTYAFGGEEIPPPPGQPSIIAYNNITGTSDHVPLDYGTTVLFNATAGNSITWAWTLDGVDQSTPYDNYTHTFSAGFGYYAVTVNATNADGTDLYTWGIWENIETTAVPVPTFTDTSYQMLLDSIDYPPNMEDFGKAMAHPFVEMVGVIFYLFIFGIPLLMMYIRQDNMTLPTTLLLLFGSIIIFMLPPQWQIIAGALMTLGFVGILFKLYKERER